MPSINQLIKSPRKPKVKKIKARVLDECPQRRGVCVKVYVRTPKKPNSALRKVAKVHIMNSRNVLVYLPGQAFHNLQQFSVVLIRGGRVPDLPGFKYRAIRGCYDFSPVDTRRQGRSKYGRKRKKITIRRKKRRE